MTQGFYGGDPNLTGQSPDARGRPNNTSQFMLDGNGMTSRQRWMLYVVYGAAALVFLSGIVLLATLNETRAFIGDKGVEYCWMYGNFDRYLFTHLALFCVDIVTLLCLYWFARRNYLLAYLVVGAAWLLYDPLLSLLDMSYC